MSADVQQALEALAAELGKILHARGERLVTAESCTGGWAAQCVTAVAGSSAWFDRGFVTYSNESKQEMLDVPAAILTRFGAVSEATALAMASGALLKSHAHWAVAITGIAGPQGGSEQKPVGTVCFAWAGRGSAAEARTEHFPGEREAVRALAVDFALRGVLARAGRCPVQGGVAG